MKTFQGVAAVAATALLLTGCADTSSPTAGPSTAPSSSVPLPPSDTPPPVSTPTDQPSTPTSTPQTGCLDQKLAGLTLRERAAQLIMTGITATGMTSAERTVVRGRKPGGVLLMGNGGSLAHTRTAMAAATAAATVDGIRPFVAADQEGGKIQRLKGTGFDRIPAATVQAGWSAQKLTSEATQWGRQLKQAGVNLDLAPVADVVPKSLGDGNAPIGALDRGYGSTPGPIGVHVAAFVKGMDAAGVMTSVKHFPGLGRVRGNTDFSAGVVDTVTVRGDADLAPFAAGIEAGSDLVMVSTVTYTKIDKTNRAVFSPTIVQGMLRGDLGYDGVVITDDVGAAAEVASVPAGDRATLFIEAGGDVVITAKASLTATMVDAVVAKAQQDKKFSAQVDASVRRVLALKQSRGLVSCG
ncbi:glycoside hydrolase family 3 N-terminal domain-containing protein [Kribbella sp. NPDC051770]|uniref:glycoside hydrolase family 3 N-terminal domain-containing protein n=1 Tax=Kribbella sp. NPDC051770 TaxID=3155413 RepID=UPI00341B1FDE